MLFSASIPGISGHTVGRNNRETNISDFRHGFFITGNRQATFGNVERTFGGAAIIRGVVQNALLHPVAGKQVVGNGKEFFIPPGVGGGLPGGGQFQIDVKLEAATFGSGVWA